MQKSSLLKLTLILGIIEAHFFVLEVHASDFYGSMYINHALVHYILPEQGCHAIPVIMIPGFNLSSSIFVSTPDGRDGWAQLFAGKGYDVYVINDPTFDFLTGDFSVAPFDVPVEGAPPEDPDSAQGWQRDIWKRWGFGESEGNPYPDTRFPTDHFEVFENNYPYVATSKRDYSDSIISLLEMVGPAVLLAHSAGGPQAVDAALERPDLVVGFIMVEPTGPPDENNFPALAGMSMIGVYGDYIVSRNQGSRKTATEQAAVLFSQNGGAGKVLSLPDDYGIYGNTHIMMQDNNNAFIADLIMDWMADHTQWEYAFGCPDLDGEDLFVDFLDFSVFAENWGQTGDCIIGDFDNNRVVDLNDLAYFIDQWLSNVSELCSCANFRQNRGQSPI